MTPDHDPLSIGDHSLSRRALVRGVFAGGVLLGTGGLLAACGTDDKTAPKAATGGAPKRGGQLRIGVAGGGPQDSLDAHRADASLADAMRSNNLYEPLAIRDRDFGIELLLAESIEPDGEGLDAWIVKLKDGIQFHDGRTVGADDVIASFERILDPKDPKSAATALSTVQVKRIKKVDELTVRIPLSEPNANFRDDIARITVAIVPTDYDPKKPVGTGPFVYKSFEPGRQSVFARNANYWQDGKPYVDQVTIIDFPDEAARVNALLGGQVDAISDLPAAQRKTIDANKAFRVLRAETGNWHAFTLRTDSKPLSDVRVRQALRLTADRDQLVKQVLAGEGRVANDVVSPLDAVYDRSLPQRSLDLEQAKSLLKSAGQSDLRLELVTAPQVAGIVQSAEVFAEQAKAAGIQIKLKKLGTDTFFGPNYKKWPFAQTYWTTRSYFAQVAATHLPSAPYNESHFNDPEFNSLIAKAKREPDDQTRTDLLHQAQKIEYERGGLLIPYFYNVVDAYSAKLGGLKPARTGLPLGNYQFKDVWFTA